MTDLIISKQSYKKTIETLKNGNLDDKGSFFAIFSTEYDNFGNVKHDFFDIISFAINNGYEYVNTIVYPTKNIQMVSFNDNVRYVIWLCKNHKTMKFNKDAIREKHIWKDVEWGKRTKNYNPKGKDPGNVWIPTEDDGNAHITKHKLLSDNDVIEKIIKMIGVSSYDYYEGELYTSVINTVRHFDKPNKRKLFRKVIFGTSENMSMIDNNSIQTVITSPPYWNLKDYFKSGQIGQESYETYLARMKAVWKECYKKLNNLGSLWININIRVHNRKVILIPYDIIRICKELGYYYKGIIIWHKSSGIPTNDKNIVDRHEYVLIFSKKKDFVTDKKVMSTFCDYINDDINGLAFWNINRKAGSVGKKYIHPAIYPNLLVERIVLASSNENDIILDPFLGSGTSLIASTNTNRSFIGFEYNEGFKDLMDSRFRNELNTYDVIYI